MIGGIPTYALTDNEKTVTDEHMAGDRTRTPPFLVTYSWKPGSMGNRDEAL